jgi:hypothetical protein
MGKLYGGLFENGKQLVYLIILILFIGGYIYF